MAVKDKKFYWIKLKGEFMNGETVDFLMSQKNGANYVVLYQMLILKTINTQGKLCTEIGEMIVPFNPEKIQRDCKWFDIDTIRVALELYSRLGLIYKDNDGILQIAHFDEIVGSETYWATQKRKKLGAVPQDQQYQYITKVSNDSFMLPNGERRFVDEKRYGGNGMLVWDRSQGKCEICGSTDNLCIHHNNGYSNAYEDLVVVCRNCHREIEEGRKSWKFVGNVPTSVQNPLISNIYNIESNRDINNEDVVTPCDKLSHPPQRSDTRFKKPTVEEIAEYCRERNNGIDAQRFFDYYEAKGWLIGKTKMKDWRAAVRTWERQTNIPSSGNHFANERKYTPEELESLISNIDDIEI